MTALLAPSRVLVTGATCWTDRAMIEELLDTFLAQKRETGGSFRVITGMADGADEFARRWALANEVPLLAEPLEPGRYPGPMHAYNDQMLAWAPELVLAFKQNFADDWDEDSRAAGTEHMARIAARGGVPVLLNGALWLDAERSTPEDPQVDQCQFPVIAKWGSVLVRVVHGDITKAKVDVIVNAANSSLLGGGGVDGAIHQAAGPDLLEACGEVVARQGGCATGEAVITRAGELDATHVVHTVGPVFTRAKADEHDAMLARCYTESLRLGAENDAASIAFPSISTGVYRFPKPRAADVATTAVKEWLATVEHGYDEVVFVCFGQNDFDLYTSIIEVG